MSNFSTIYDELIATTIPGLTGYSTKTQIPIPYELSLNDMNSLRNGWGILIGDASQSDFQDYKDTWVDQSISFVLTRVLRTTHHNKTPMETETKQLIEDAILIRLDLYNADQITIPDNIQKIDFVSRSGIEFIDAEEFKILTTTVEFSFTISETI
jgi:hypothetical protein